jgi:cytochrome c peroxidase
MNVLKCSRVARLWGPCALAGLLVFAGCGSWTDDLLCEGPNCEFTGSEWSRVQSLANLGDPLPDPSNKYSDPNHPTLAALYPQVVDLGWKLYYDPYFAGAATWVDGVGRRVPFARADRCETPNRPTTCKKMEVSCASCHDPAQAGSDFTSRPGHVSEGSAWYDVNGQQTLNAGHYKIFYWNGRSDSLWAQVAAVIESDVSMNGNRMEIVRRVAEQYRTQYEAIFTDPLDKLPDFPPRDRLEAQLVGSVAGECAGAVAGACPEFCEARAPDANQCWPILPLRGKGGRFVGCQAGDPYYKEPFDDAFDCAPQATRDKINRVFSNFAKAIAAYEGVLASQNAPFDQYVNGAHGAISGAAVRGLKLFVGKAACIDCHKTALFSDSDFHNIGVPQSGQMVPTDTECTVDKCNCNPAAPAVIPPPGAPPPPPTVIAGWPGASCLPWGFVNGMAKLRSKTFRRDGKFSDDPNLGADYKAKYYDLADNDESKPADSTRRAWRTPSLRDVAMTAPYMHDGVYRSLDDVVWHYDQGGTATLGTKAPELRPLRLSNQERLDLVEFLKTLTGSPSPGRDLYHHMPPGFLPKP